VHHEYITADPETRKKGRQWCILEGDDVRSSFRPPLWSGGCGCHHDGHDEVRDRAERRSERAGRGGDKYWVWYYWFYPVFNPVLLDYYRVLLNLTLATLGIYWVLCRESRKHWELIVIFLGPKISTGYLLGTSIKPSAEPWLQEPRASWTNYGNH
jgi:hypothetical protein